MIYKDEVRHKGVEKEWTTFRIFQGKTMFGIKVTSRDKCIHLPLSPPSFIQPSNNTLIFVSKFLGY